MLNVKMQHLEKYSSITDGIQGLAKKEQARSTTDWKSGEAQDGRDEGLYTVGGRRQAAISFRPDADGTGSGSLLEPGAYLHL